MTAEIDYAGVELIIKPVFEILDAPVQQARLENRDTSAGKFLKKNRMDRVGNLKDGKTVAFIPDPNTKTWATDNYTGTSAVEGVAVDAKANIYAGEVGPQDSKNASKSNRGAR